MIDSSSVPSECLLEAKSGPCEAAMIRYYYDSKTGKCTTFTYGGCEANGNNFKSLSECQQRCISSDAPKNESQVKAICQLKYDIGPCDAAILRYFYNTTSGKCEQFVYGGCAGNANNFNTLDECHKECINRQVTSKLRVENAAICTQEAAAGLCKANLVRYYFNATSEECQPFIYGGCGGNSNNFERTLDCQTTCTVTS